MRKPKILWHAPNPADGTSMYRAVPFKRIDSVELVPFNINDRITWETIYDIDICFFQRPANQIEVRLIAACKKFNKKVWIDYDDLTLDITNDTNPAAEHYEKDAIKATILESLKIADVVTVSTEPLKEALLDYVPTANITVVPNAIDDELFLVEPSYHKREKRILLRGAGSHKFDWELYSPGIIQVMKNHPDYKLSVFGFHPPWLKAIPANQIEYYDFADIPTYFHNLMLLRPEFMIVPLVDDKFNQCKSAISFYEGCMAGAITLSPDLPDFKGTIKFGSNEELIQQIETLIAIRGSSLFQGFYEEQLNHVRILSDVNELRKDIIEDLLKNRRKFHPTLPKLTVATAEEFHSYALAYGHSQDDPGYQQGTRQAMEWIITTLRPKTSVEFGTGTGACLVELLKAGTMAYGLEYNPVSVQYFKDHHPMYENQVTLFDITKEAIEVDAVCDLGMCLEVFEHIDMPEEWWESFILDLSKKFRHFYFSSTPYKYNDEFDEFWGHINLRRTTDWIDLFERNGWKFEQNPKKMTSWDVLFSSKNV